MSWQQLGSSTGSVVGPGSHESEQAPVGVPFSGSKHGAHTWSAGQFSCGSDAACAAISGKHVDRQRPSAPKSDSHLSGMKLPPLLMIASGTQNASALHSASFSCCSGGTTDFGMQCPPPHIGH